MKDLNREIRKEIARLYDKAISTHITNKKHYKLIDINEAKSRLDKLYEQKYFPKIEMKWIGGVKRIMDEK